MKTFRQYLFEQQEHLYHGTSIFTAAAIVDSGYLLEGTHWGKPNEPHGPRFTRGEQIARGFIGYSCHWCGGNGAVFVFDRAKLAADYEIVQYQDAGYDGTSFGDEQEEAVITDRIPIAKYLVQIIVQEGAFEFAVEGENIEAMQSEGPDPFNGNVDALRRALDKLQRHPKLKMDRWEEVHNWQ